MKTKIVHIIPTLHLGGAERIMVDLVYYGNHDEFDFSVITIVDGGPFEAEIRALGIPYYALCKNGFGFGMLIELTRLLRHLNPDIVHTHLFGAHMWGMAASIFNGVPVRVMSEQNTDVDLGALRHGIKKIVSCFADVVIAASSAIQDFLVSKEKVYSKKIVVIKNAIELEKYLELPAPQFKKQLQIICIGRLEMQKGHDVLFDALSHVQFPWELTLVGEGSLRKDLAVQALRLGIHDRVHFVGAIHDVSELIDRHDVVVMPSRWEGIGLVIMEGMASARPVVASRVGGIPELITHGETGLLVEPENPQALAEILTWVWEHPDAARALGVHARAYARANCDVRKMTKKYEQLYAHLTHK